ncbi:MAG TPA: hypothetical protein VN957_25475 [Chthoniobacterales bacterium]|nr:hypothetical protein [Chthoniobacterales bacterium]
MSRHRSKEAIAIILRNKELSRDEKREQLRALIPDDSLKINDLSKATLEQLAQLQAGLDITQSYPET